MLVWDHDPTGKWTDMKIELMTGSNLAMVPLKGANFFPDVQCRPAGSQQFNSDHYD